MVNNTTTENERTLQLPHCPNCNKEFGGLSECPYCHKELIKHG